jgi:acetolactate synthase-1/2/3 large subunit
LIHHNVKHVFGYSGGANLPLLDQFYESKHIQIIKNSNESCSGFSAEGYSKSLYKTKPGVVLTTSGPGITNMITPMQNALSDGSPMVVISAQVPMSSLYTDSFQECRATDLTKHCTKWNTMITDPYKVSQTMDEAFRISMEDRQGPVHIDIPKDILLQKSFLNSECNGFIRILRTKHDSSIPQIYNIIKKSMKPILLIGQGCNHISDMITQFAEENTIPVASTIHGMGVLNETNQLSLQMCGMHGHPVANMALQEADLIIGIGTRFDDRITGKLSSYGENARKEYGIIHIDSSTKQIKLVRKNFQKHFQDTDFLHQLTMDSKQFISSLIGLVNTSCERQEWIQYLRRLRVKYTYHTGWNYHKLYTPDVIKAINQSIRDLKIDRDNLFITTGVGNHQMWTAQHITWTSPGKMITSGSLGTMGVGVPFAIGCQLANPESMVLCIDGDSSFNMTSNDLQTILEYNIPIKIAIMNDKRQQMVHVWQQLFHQNRIIATENINPDYNILSQAYQIPTLFCDSKKTINQTVTKFLSYDKGPVLAVFNTEPSMCFPLVAPGRALDDMILNESDIPTINPEENAPN